MSRKSIWIVLGIVVLTAAGAAGWYFLGDSDDGTAAAAPSALYQPLPTDHTMGNPNAHVVMIEYASPTCPVCANFMINLFPRVKKNYIDTGKVFYVYRTFLRGPDDGVAEKLARCMPKGKYMAFVDTLFRNQPKWDYEYGIASPDSVHAALVQLAQGSGMSPAEADRCIASTSDEAAINKVSEDAVSRYQVDATPTFVINGAPEAGFENLFQRLDVAVGAR